jgi:hypothetical protein
MYGPCNNNARLSMGDASAGTLVAAMRVFVSTGCACFNRLERDRVILFYNTYNNIHNTKCKLTRSKGLLYMYVNNVQGCKLILLFVGTDHIHIGVRLFQ